MSCPIIYNAEHVQDFLHATLMTDSLMNLPFLESFIDKHECFQSHQHSVLNYNGKKTIVVNFEQFYHIDVDVTDPYVSLDEEKVTWDNEEFFHLLCQIQRSMPYRFNFIVWADNLWKPMYLDFDGVYLTFPLYSKVPGTIGITTVSNFQMSNLWKLYGILEDDSDISLTSSLDCESGFSDSDSDID